MNAQITGALKKFECVVKIRVRDSQCIVFVSYSITEELQTQIRNEVCKHGDYQVRFICNTMYKPRDIGRVIVVGAGKGGVGKSTVTAQFAHYLAEQNIRVGVIDADIHQPSLTRMLGIGAQEIRAVDNKIVPAKHSNISMLSLGFWVAESNAVVWSSSMGIELLRQFVDGAWDDCDVILVDLPPGTGEIQSALLQMIEVHRVVLVATPQCVAIDGVRRFARMVDVLGIPVAGFVANMSRECPVEIDGCTQLASVSYDPEIADACDKGVRSKSLEIAQMCRVMHGLL